MSFEDMFNSTIFIEGRNGKKIGPFSAVISRNKIVLFRNDVQIYPGDKVYCKRSNGIEETYTVIDPGFYEKDGNIPAAYQMTVKRDGLIEDKKSISITNNIHMNGNRNKVYAQSIDNSVNISHRKTLQTYIDQLQEQIANLDNKKFDKAEVQELIDAIRENALSDKPSWKIISTLAKGLPHIDCILSILEKIKSLLDFGAS